MIGGERIEGEGGAARSDSKVLSDQHRRRRHL